MSLDGQSPSADGSLRHHCGRFRHSPRAPHGNRMSRLGRSPDLRVITGTGLPAGPRSGDFGAALRLQLRGQSRIWHINAAPRSLFIERRTVRTKADQMCKTARPLPIGNPWLVCSCSMGCDHSVTHQIGAACSSRGLGLGFAYLGVAA